MKRAVAALLLLAATPAAADGLIDNVAGQTRDAGGKAISFTGLLIGSDGRVTKLLARGDKPPKKLDYRLDARGRTLVPGRIAPAQALMAAAVPMVVREPLMQGRPLQPYERDLAFSLIQKKLLAEGITTVVDIDTGIADWNVYRRAGDAGRLRIRILSYAAGIEPMAVIAGNQPTPWLYGGRLRMAGLAVVDSPPFDDARVRNLISRGAMDGFQIALLPRGDGAVDHALAAIEEVAGGYGTTRRWRLETGGAPAPDAARLAHSGTVVVGTQAQDSADAAYAALAEDQIGSLTPGHYADFLLLKADGSLDETWVGGIRVLK